MSGGRPSIRSRVEAAADMALERVLKAYRDAGLGRLTMARHFGLHYSSLYRAIRREGLDHLLPADYSSNMGARVEIDGRAVPLAIALRERGLNRKTVAKRWVRGERDPGRLLAPPAARGGARRSLYEIGWSEAEWHAALEFADQLGDDRRAAWRLGVPLGALSAARDGDYERLA